MITNAIDTNSFVLLREQVEMSGSIERLRLVDTELTEFLYALASLMGGSLESVDAFVTEAPGAAPDWHRVYWLRGKTIGSLAVGAHQGADGSDEQPIRLDGYVRPIADIRKLEFQEVQIVWSRTGLTHIPEIWPTMQIHFDDFKIVISVAGRPNGGARKQATTFIDRLQAALAGV